MNIFDFTRFRKFLAEYQERRQAAEPSFSRTEFCNLLGLPNTRSYFNDVVQGKRVTDNMRERFINVIGLKGNEAKYFEAMIDFDQGKTAQVREAAFDAMMRLNKNPQAIVDPDSYEFFGNWYNSTVYAILEVMDVADDVSELASKIFPPVSEKKLQASLKLMQKMNLVRKNESGFWKPTKDSLATVQQSKSQMVLQFQKQCLELSKQALESAGKESRDMTTFTFSVSKKAQKQVEVAAEKFKVQIRHIVTADSEKPEIVEHINLHVFSNIREDASKASDYDTAAISANQKRRPFEKDLVQGG
ncbi:TIGR02147 family protein [uncultured Fibrobacter sp.]|uniref:TIGR02147 family protein n=1 Tax=uncultured Fibrobacter sp. TaxID=261512 RepID=UPI0025D80F92|nr:TIGR02147 family protein [uncultured Fibrobacter sp.]